MEQAQASLAPLEEIPGDCLSPRNRWRPSPSPLAVRAARILLGRMEGGNENCSAAHLGGPDRPLPQRRSVSGTESPGRRHRPPGVQPPDLDTLRPSGGTGKSSPAALPGTAEWAGWTVHSTPELYRGQRQGPLQFWLDQDAVHALTLRGRRTGDRLKLPGRPTKTVKNGAWIRRSPPGSARGFQCWTAAAVWPGWQAWDRTPLCSPARSARVAHPADPAPGISKLGRAGAIRPAIHSAAVIVRKGRSIMLEKDIQEILFSEGAAGQPGE